MDALATQFQVLGRRIDDTNLWRQCRCINLIPSENTPSLLRNWPASWQTSSCITRRVPVRWHNCSRFVSMHSCPGIEEGINLAAALFESIFADSADCHGVAAAIKGI